MNYKAITHIPYRLFMSKDYYGLEPTPKDERDFNLGIFNWFGYQPKHKKKINNTLSVRDQSPHNTCQWHASIASKEPDEKILLNIRTFVAKGNKMGLVSGNGFSNLRSGMKVLKEWGACPVDVIAENNSNWQAYVNVNTDLYNNRASKHKVGSFWSTNSRDDIFKLIDEGRILTTGMRWYTGFNMNGGFRSPWLIRNNVGLYVGGHAIALIGYDLNYQGRKVWVLQNSYGKEWGDNGLFYIDMDYMDSNNYGFFTHVDDIDTEVGNLLTQYDGKNVKGNKSNGIFHLQAGKKKPYPSWESFLSWNGKQRGFYEVDQATLDRIEEGDIMDITKTDYWQFLKDVKEAKRLDALLTLLNKNN